MLGFMYDNLNVSLIFVSLILDSGPAVVDNGMRNSATRGQALYV